MKNSRRKLFKILKRIVLIAISLLIIFAITGYFLGKAYEDKIEQIVVNEINKNLNSEVSVGSIKFSLLKDFPFATLLFYDVLAKDASTNSDKDTLLESELISLHFNIIDILQENYVLKHIVLADAKLNLRVYNSGKDNFHFLKIADENASTSFSLQLQRVILKKVLINFNNEITDQDYSVFAENAALKGKFSEKNYSLDVDGNLRIGNINSGKISYLKDQNSTIDLLFDVDKQKQEYLIKRGKIKIDNLAFDITGSVTNTGSENNIDLKLVGKNLSLSSVIQKLPQKYKIHFRNLKSKGHFFLTSHIFGLVGKNKSPRINAEFNFERGKITHKKTSVALNDVQFTGIYTNGETQNSESSSIQINDFSAGLKKGIIKGEFELSNFNKPEIVFNTDSEFELRDLQDFVKINTIKSISGIMDLKATYKGKLNSIDNFTPKDLISSTTSGRMTIKNMDYQLVGDAKEYENINADISFNNNDLIVHNLEAEVAESDFKLEGQFKNFLHYLFVPDENLIIEAKLKSQNVKLDNLLASNSSETDEEYILDFSDRLEFYLDFDIEKLTFEKFEADKINGRLKLIERKLNVPYLSMNSQDGTTSIKGNIDGTEENKLLISCEAIIKNVDVGSLFYEFENFSQSGMTDKNIGGTLTANIMFSGTWNSYLKVDPASIYTKTNLIIENGSLVDYPPLMGLSEHIKDADLANVHFSTLQNQIEIKNEQILIPEMEINSDAIDIFASGTHKFNNEIEYHLRLLWSELKSKKQKKNEEEFGVVIDDGLNRPSLFFIITGTLDDPVVKYDRKGLKKKIANDLKNEGKNLKQAFEQEFSSKKDDPVALKEKTILKKQEEGNFVIEWDEDEKDSVIEPPMVKKKERPEVYIEWDDDDEDNDTIKNN